MRKLYVMSNVHAKLTMSNSATTSQSPKRIHILGTGKRRDQAFVNGSQQGDHDRTADVHEPIGHGPVNLRSILLDFVGFLVALMISSFTRAGDQQDRRLGDKSCEPSFCVFSLLTGGGNPLLGLGVCNEEKRLSLCK